MIPMLARAALYLTVHSGSAFLLRPSHLVMASAEPCRAVVLQFGLQPTYRVRLSTIFLSLTRSRVETPRSSAPRETRSASYSCSTAIALPWDVYSYGQARADSRATRSE